MTIIGIITRAPTAPPRVFCHFHQCLIWWFGQVPTNDLLNVADSIFYIDNNNYQPDLESKMFLPSYSLWKLPMSSNPRDHCQADATADATSGRSPPGSLNSGKGGGFNVRVRRHRLTQIWRASFPSYRARSDPVLRSKYQSLGQSIIYRTVHIINKVINLAAPLFWTRFSQSFGNWHILGSSQYYLCINFC